MGVSVKEAAKFLNLSEGAVRKLIAGGRLQAGHEGRRIVIAESELEVFRGGNLGPGGDSGAAAGPREEGREEMERREQGERQEQQGDVEEGLRDEPVPESGAEDLKPGAAGQAPTAALQSPHSEPGPRAPKQTSLSDAVVRPVLERLSALERQLSERLDVIDENRRLAEEIRKSEQQIALRDQELEKLKRDLLYQKKIFEKELQDYAKLLDEKWAVREQEVEDRIDREREGFEQRLVLEKSVWSERLAQEQEKHAACLADAQRGQGFWAKIVRMLTWS
jgi:excisionase family DNA binding protein